MNSKKSDRRGFLKSGATLAGLAAGSGRLAKGQTQDTPSKKNRRVDRLWRALPFRYFDTRACSREAFTG